MTNEERIAELEAELERTKIFAEEAEKVNSECLAYSHAQLAAMKAAGDGLATELNIVQRQGCEVCNGDCAAANPPVGYCPTQARRKALTNWTAIKGDLG